jgi:PilZ domain
MLSEKRQHVRVGVNIAAKMSTGPGSPLRDCTVTNISTRGAKLAIDSPEDVPERITILLSPRGVPYRKCRVVWRSEGHVGVEFD